jgi:hypothetical protein
MLEIHGSDDESSLVLHHAAQPAPPARRVRRRIERPTDGEYAVFLIVVLPSRLAIYGSHFLFCHIFKMISLGGRVGGSSAP